MSNLSKRIRLEVGSTVAALSCALSLVSCGVTSATPSARRPNVILMMADDLASNDLGCYGGARIPTPRIDRFAGEGLRLTSYYAGSSVCTPSRMALMSGAYPARLGWRWGVMGYGIPLENGMSPAVYTIAEAFRDAGYRTAMAGKWHLGSGGMGPGPQGFASAFYIRMSNNQNRDMYRDGQLVQADWDNRRLTEAFAEEARRVIRGAGDEPFFLYLPWSAPHFPAEPHPGWDGRSGTDRSARYADVVAELDARVGEILDELAAAGLADDTIVVFTSDNGRQSGQQANPPDPLYRGQKWQSLEGGTRVPCVMRYPNRIEPGVSAQFVSAMDLFPTLASACGVPIDPPGGAQALDGLDLGASLFARGRAGREPSGARNELLYWHGKGPATAIRVGDWKLRFHAGDQKPLDPALADGPVLHHLAVDEREQVDLAERHPDRVHRMLHRAREALRDVYGRQVPLGVAQAGGAALPPLKAEDVWGPWLGR